MCSWVGSTPHEESWKSGQISMSCTACLRTSVSTHDHVTAAYYSVASRALIVSIAYQRQILRNEYTLFQIAKLLLLPGPTPPRNTSPCRSRRARDRSTIHVHAPVHIPINLTTPPDWETVRHTTASKDGEGEDEDDDLRSSCDGLDVIRQ